MVTKEELSDKEFFVEARGSLSSIDPDSVEAYMLLVQCKGDRKAKTFGGLNAVMGSSKALVNLLTNLPDSLQHAYVTLYVAGAFKKDRSNDQD